MSNIQQIYKLSKQMEKIYKKVVLLNKKHDSIGLTDEENEKLNELRSESWLLHEELVETHLNISVMPYLITPEYNDALKVVTNMTAWKGGFIRREEDLNELFDKIIDLNDNEMQMIADKLELMHLMVMQRFELFCSSEEGYDHIKKVSKVITTETDGNVLDVLAYLDSRYRELAELLDIELQEVEVRWEDDEECQD